MSMRSICSEIVFVFLLLLIGGSSFAQESNWVIRGAASYSSTTSSASTVDSIQQQPLGMETISQNVAGGPGFEISLEYMLNKRLGVEAAAILTYHDSDMVISNDLGTFVATDATRFRTFTVGLNYYFDTQSRAQWSLGGFVPLMFVDGTDHIFPALNRTEGRAYDQDYGVGVKGGMQWSFAPESPWTLSIEGRYMFLLTMESETVGDIDVDPAILSMGIGYRF